MDLQAPSAGKRTESWRIDSRGGPMGRQCVFDDMAWNQHGQAFDSGGFDRTRLLDRGSHIRRGPLGRAPLLGPCFRILVKGG